MIGNRYAAELIRLLQSKQITAETALQNTGLDWNKLRNGEQIVRKQHMHTLIANAHRLYDEPDLGLQFGRRLNTNTHGILGFALMSCSTLYELVQVWLKYHSINHSELRLEYRIEGETAVLEARLASDQTTSQIFAKEVLFASVYTTLSFLLNEDPDWAELCFDYPSPSYLNRYIEVFHQAPTFSQSQCQLRAPVELLSKPLPSANPAAARMYQQQCAEMLRTLTQRQGLARQVQKLLLEHHGDFPRIADLAAMLHMSERTLRRKLTAEGTSFQEVFNDVRFKLAGEYLESTNLSVADIADLLGFADPSNFRRAFIQWAELSPAQYRRSRSA
ncbi:MAG: AraC family transcriptional regulator ligand-binding domain-containing protein [Pseudomonadales bacterium]